jgi:hypothetical protein
MSTQAEQVAAVVRKVRPRAPYLTVRSICRLEVSVEESAGRLVEPSNELVAEVARLVGEDPDETPTEKTRKR